MVWRLHDHAICNAHVIYKANNSTSLSKSFTNYQFRLKLIEALTEPLLEVGRGPGRTPVTTDKRLAGKHFLHHSAVRKQCAVCSARKLTPEGKICKYKKVKTWCPKRHLCVGPVISFNNQYKSCRLQSRDTCLLLTLYLNYQYELNVKSIYYICSPF